MSLDPTAFGESTLQGGLLPADDRPPAPSVRVSMFDACHVGVVLRAVMFVESVVGVGAMFGAAQPMDWLLRFSLLTGGALPATLAWLIAACGLKTRLHRLTPRVQWLALRWGLLPGFMAVVCWH